MNVKILDFGNWKSVYRACLNTISKETDRTPTSEWKRKILLSEHSPIRKLHIGAKWYSLKSWVSVHLVRHKHGVEHFVSSRRTDRTGVDRDALRQDELVDHEMDLNAQAIINISRKRLCTCASKETRQAWKTFLKELESHEPELVKVCVKDCVYRGHCFEFYSCNYHKTDAFNKEREEYIKGIN